MEKTEFKELRVRGIGKEVKEQMHLISMQKYGEENFSRLIRELITNELQNFFDKKQAAKINLMSKPKRLQLTIPESCYFELSNRAEQCFESKSDYVARIIYKEFEVAQLRNNEIEVLRESNYTLSKIGNNLNQLAKAFNTLILSQGNTKLPPISRDIDKVRKSINAHTEKVLEVLKIGSYIKENKGSNQTKKPKQKIKGLK